jgi:hypothetical protein
MAQNATLVSEEFKAAPAERAVGMRLGACAMVVMRRFGVSLLFRGLEARDGGRPCARARWYRRSWQRLGSRW